MSCDCLTCENYKDFGHIFFCLSENEEFFDILANEGICSYKPECHPCGCVTWREGKKYILKWCGIKECDTIVRFVLKEPLINGKKKQC